MRSLKDISVQFVKGVGPARKKIFTRLGIENIDGLLYFFPRRYEDRRHLTPIAQAEAGEMQTVSGKVVAKTGRRSWHTKKHVCEVSLDDGTGRMSCIWFNQAYLSAYFKEGVEVVCYGKVDVYKNNLQMVSPEYEIIENEKGGNLNTGRIVPIYPLTKGITQRYLRRTIMACLDCYKDQLHDGLPVPLRNKHRLANIKRSINNIHFPGGFEEQEEALRRVSFEEFYFFQISVILRRLSITRKQGFSHKISDASTLRFINSFPFELTGAQKKVIREIRSDMRGEHPMLRLLQGDVGSGKTLPALFGCLAAFENGNQSAFMAPTEILARQHYENACRMVNGGPLKNMKAALLVSGIRKSEKEKLCQKIKGGEIDLVIGTHALITEGISFKKLSFVVIDEQHKFGVRQRALLTGKGVNPDVLIMTATPIPRTLCITLYGDLDASVIDELPPGRGKIKTLHYTGERFKEAYELIRVKIKQGRQAYVVYPIIEESEKLDLKAAQDMYKHFVENEFKGFSVGLVHGRMRQKDTREIMEKFKAGKIDILVATTVLEVGVDVPNASVMVIEHAERFGLAQLHQLRGRIGRGGHDAFCILVSDPQTTEAIERIKAILSTTDGFKIAQKDLAIRGPGHFFGRHQHGLNELKVINPETQLDVLELARKEAIALLDSDPDLTMPPHAGIKTIVRERYPTYLSMVAAG